MVSKICSFVSALYSDWKIRAAIVLVVLMVWLSILCDSDSFFIPTILLVMICIVSCVRSSGNAAASGREKTICAFYSAFFSMAIVLANYSLLLSSKIPLVKGAFLFAGGFIVGWYILESALNMEISAVDRPDLKNRKLVLLWFFSPFFCISLVYLLALFFCYRPGLLTPDSISQIKQVLGGTYTNHHPFWHTMIIKAALDFGMAVFHDINMGVMMYSIFQILCMAAVFSYICMTMYEAGIPAFWIGSSCAAYAFLPYHILYSMTMWKDILFGGAAALFVCALFRIMKDIGSKAGNYSTLTIGALGTCLLRSNGMTAFMITFVFLTVFLKKEKKKIFLVLLGVIVTAFMLKHPVLKALNVSQPDTAEYLSIPAQQIARVIVDNERLEEKELQQIEQFMDTESVRDKYKPFISDPVKSIIRKTNPDYLKEHKPAFLILWVQLGLKHPGSYFSAWIDQTKGYWNGGYEYWIVTTGIRENSYGIEMVSQNNIISWMLKKYVSKFFHHSAFEVFRSIGLHVWMILLCTAVLLVKQRKDVLLHVLPLAVILTLLVSTPVFSEFRYAYAVFTSFPFLVLTTFAARRE